MEAISGCRLHYPERDQEERRGLIGWLRPEFQDPDAVAQETLTKDPAEPVPAIKPAAKPTKQPSPKTLSAQAAAVQSALATIAAPADESDIAKHFTRAKKERIAELLDTLTSLGKARELDDGRYLAVYGCCHGLNISLGSNDFHLSLTIQMEEHSWPRRSPEG
jgi:hypothetical protein